MRKSFSVFFILMSGFSLLLAGQDVPKKVKEEFEVKIELKFRERPSKDASTVNVSGKTALTGTSSYLSINFKMLISNNETRLKTVHGNKEKSRKIEVNEVVKIPMGFVDDLKSKDEPHQITLLLLSEKKEPISIITLSVEEDGTFLVNGEKRGKF